MLFTIDFGLIKEGGKKNEINNNTYSTAQTS